MLKHLVIKSKLQFGLLELKYLNLKYDILDQCFGPMKQHLYETGSWTTVNVGKDQYRIRSVSWWSGRIRLKQIGYHYPVLTGIEVFGIDNYLRIKPGESSLEILTKYLKTIDHLLQCAQRLNTIVQDLNRKSPIMKA